MTSLELIFADVSSVPLFRCDKSNAEEIVLEMLAYLETADYSIREEMVLKVQYF